MWDIIRSLVARGTTLLLTTQYLDEADELADEIVVIDHGLVIAAGTSEELKGRVGGDVLEFTVPDRTRLGDAVAAITTIGESEPHVDEETGVVSVGVGSRGSDALDRGGAQAGRRRRRDSRPGAAPPVARRRVPRPDRARRRGRGPGGRAPPGPPARRRQASAEARTRRRHGHDRGRRSPAPAERRAQPGHPGPVGGQRHAHDHPAQPAGLDARARLHRVHRDPAGDVRAAVPLRVRRRDPGDHTWRLRQLPDAGDHRADRGVRLASAPRSRWRRS